MKPLILTLALFGSALAAPLTNCGLTLSPQQAPRKAVTLNQSATEIMLALGLQDRMIGTAYLDDAVLPELQAQYRQVPVLAVEYPSSEALLNLAPDFIYGAYGSAFGKEVAGPRTDLLKLGITPYLSQTGCEDKTLRPKTTTLKTVYQEIQDIASIFQVESRGQKLVRQLQNGASLALRDVKKLRFRTPLRVFWYDSETQKPLAGGAAGAPGMIMRSVGVKNIFEDLNTSWGEVTWEAVLNRKPDVIVLADASWDRAQDRIQFLKSHPALKELPAVKNNRFIVLPFSDTTLGLRNVRAMQTIALKLQDFQK